jgi:hypothetical protein
LAVVISEPMKISPILRHILVASVLVAGFFVLALPGVPNLPFFYDEADYAYASQQGWFANWVDHPALNLVQFVHLGMSAGRDHSRRLDLSQTIRNSGDVHFYRHWHGPLFYQWLGLIGHWTSREYNVRLLSLLIPEVGVILVYFGCLWAIPSSQLIAILAAAFYGFGYSVVASPELAPHQLFVLVSLAGLFGLAKLEITGDVKWWWWSCIWAAVSFVTIEVAFVNIAVALYIGWRRRMVLLQVRYIWLRSIGLFLATTLLLWPAAIFKLEPVRSYIFMAYLAIARKGAWGNTTLAETWLLRLQSEPFEWIFVAIALVVWWFLPKKTEKYVALPFLTYGVLMLIVMFKVNAVVPHYALPYLAPLTVFAGITLGAAMQNWPKLTQVAASTAMIVLVAAGTYRYVHKYLPAGTPRMLHILESAKSRPLDGRILLAPQVDVSALHYYFPHAKLILYLDENDKQRALATGQPIDVILSDENEPLRIDYVSDHAQ